MDYQGFTDDSLIMMYEGVREALAADDALRQLGVDVRFRVRETPAWKLHAADLEAREYRRPLRHLLSVQTVHAADAKGCDRLTDV